MVEPRKLVKFTISFFFIRIIPSIFCWFFVCLIIFFSSAILGGITSGKIESPKIASISSLYDLRFIVAFPVSAAIILLIFGIATVVAKKIQPYLSKWPFLHKPLIEDKKFKHKIYEEVIIQFIALGSISTSIAIHACLSNFFFKTSIATSSIWVGASIGVALWGAAAFIWCRLIGISWPTGLPANPTESAKAPSLVDKDVLRETPSNPNAVASGEPTNHPEKLNAAALNVDSAGAPPTILQANRHHPPPESGEHINDSAIR